jgi:hypothetical protein
MVFRYGQAERSYIHYMVHKGQRGARKRIYNKADNTTCSTFIALHLADTLVKHGQANPYTDTHGGWITRYRFSLALGPALGLALSKAFFLYTRKVFAFKWAREDFPCNGKQSAWTYKGTASDYK